MRKTVPAVRILPMSPNQESFHGLGIAEVQQWFFLTELPSPRANGRYRYPTSGLDAERGAAVLFQYQARVIASAVFVDGERFGLPEDGYKGALWFDPESIRTFNPVGATELRAVWPEFRNFGRAKQSLAPRRYRAFERMLTGVRAPAR